MIKDFPCTQCGACCRRTREFLSYCAEKNIDVGYEYPVNPDGSCGHLIGVKRSDGQPGWGCEIYATRPEICRIEKQKPTEVSDADYLQDNISACNSLQELDNMPTLYRILLDS
jgi:Fe-S-cluster containining protein